jgi:hypothetical protein
MLSLWQATENLVSYRFISGHDFHALRRVARVALTRLVSGHGFSVPLSRFILVITRGFSPEGSAFLILSTACFSTFIPFENSEA